MYSHIFLLHLCQHVLLVFMDILRQPLSGQTTQGVSWIDEKTVTSVIHRILSNAQGKRIKKEQALTEWRVDEEIL